MNITHKAALLLVIGTAGWGLSFPAAKAVMQAQALVLPGHGELFHAALILLNRMLIATAVLLLFLRRRMAGLTGLELRQGVELGLFGGLGMLLQTDAQHYIPASTSAFFTQFTSIFVPIAVAVQTRRAPSRPVLGACALVMAGCMILGSVEVGSIGLGRGEWETIASAALFTGQILCLERARFRANDMLRTATVMFAVKALVFLPVVLASSGFTFTRAYSNLPVMVITVILGLVCTAFSYGVMIRWQPHVSSTQAGIIYATEPVFASIWALFLPVWFSLLAGIQYPNEEFTWRLFAGGGLMISANLLLIYRPNQPPHGDPPPAG